MKRLIILLAVMVLVVGCGGPTATPAASPNPTTAPPATVEDSPPDAAPTAEDAAPDPTSPGDDAAPEATESAEADAPPAASVPVAGADVDIASDGLVYPSYVSAPLEGGPYPGVILVHSINGMEEGYRTLSDRLAAEGFVVLALGWQTFARTPPDDTVQHLVEEGNAFLSARADVDPDRLALTGFCIGGYYTMLLLPQVDAFKVGVAWYGFPYRGSPAPADLIDDLDTPMLVIHGTEDRPSPIDDIYRYTDALTGAGKEFELLVYEGEPHGFMLQNGQMREDDVTADAFAAMLAYFRRYL